VMWHFHVTLGSIFVRLCHWMDSRNVGGNSVGNFNVRALNRRTLREQSFPCHETDCNDCLGTRGVITKWWRQFVTISTLCVNPYYVWMTVCLGFIVIAGILVSHGILCKLILIILSTLSTLDMIGLRKWAGFESKLFPTPRIPVHKTFMSKNVRNIWCGRTC
jgi:hypothetical protein